MSKYITKEINCISVGATRKIFLAIKSKTSSLSLFLLLISVFIASCSSSSSSSSSSGEGGNPGPTVKNCDATNSYNVQIPFDSTQNSISNSSDVDCFSFTLATDEQVNIHIASSADINGELFSDNRVLVGSKTTPPVQINRGLTAGRYYLRVRGGAADVVGVYTLAIEHPCPHSSATTIGQLSYQSSGETLVEGDVDCFSFTLTSGHTVAISTAGSTNTLGKLYASNGDLIETNNDGGDSNNFEIRRLLSAGIYYAEVTSEFGSIGSYTLDIARVFPDDACPSDSSEIISIPYTSSSLILADEGDGKCFSFTLTAERDIEISTTGSTNTQGKLYSSDGNIIATAQDSNDGNNFEIRTALAQGTYYVEVTSEDRSTGSYILNLFQIFRAGDCFGDTNDITSIASLPHTSSNSLADAREGDCFSFILNSPRTVSISTAGSTNTLGRLYSSDENLLASNSDDGGGNNFEIRRLLDADTYYVEVTSETQSGGSYTLNLEEVFTDGDCSANDIIDISFPHTSSNSLANAMDGHCFSFNLAEARSVNIRTTGINTDVVLYSSDGTSIVGSDTSGTSSVTADLAADTYYVEITGDRGGSYTLYLDLVFDETDCRANSAISIASIPYTSPNQILADEGSGHCFTFTLTPGTARNIEISTKGPTDTRGRLYTSSSSTPFREVRSGGTGGNFKISESLTAGTYYVVVTSDNRDTGSYTLEIPASISLSHAGSVEDTTTGTTSIGPLELDGATAVTTAVVGGTTYLFVAGYSDDGVSVFRVANDGTLTNVYNAKDTTSTNLLDEAVSLATAAFGGNTYLYVTVAGKGGVAPFLINMDGTLNFVDSEGFINSPILGTDADDSIVVTVGSNTYLYVTSSIKDALIGILANNFDVISQQQISNSDNTNYKLDGAKGLATAVVGENTYLYVTGSVDDGITVFEVPEDFSQGLRFINSYGDKSSLELEGAGDVTTANIGGTNYLFVAGADDDGVSIFRINSGGSLSHVSRITNIDRPRTMTIEEIGGATFLFVGSFNDDKIYVYRINAAGMWTSITSVSDRADSLYQLNGVDDLTTAVVGGNTYLFVASSIDDGVSVFRVNP